MCFFIPRSVYQAIVDDKTKSEEARSHAQQQIDAITNTLNAAAAARSTESKVKLRYDTVPSGFEEFSCKIYSMATVNFDEIDYKTGEVLGSSYKPLPGILLSTSQDAPYKDDQDVVTCMEGLRATYDFYKQIMKRNSIDGKGLQIEASIHYSIRFGNAQWEPDPKQMVFGDGDGNTRFGRFMGFFKHGSMIGSLDVIAHEITHGVTQHEANFVYKNQSGALNESMSDVFGSMVMQWKQKEQTVQQASWILGADMIYPNSEYLAGSKAVNLRSMKDPSAPTNLSPQPDKMSSPLYYKGKGDHGGVHTNSGVPNHAFYKVAMALGGHSWDRAGQIWYATLTDKRMHEEETFVEFATVTVDQAKKLYPTDLNVAKVVEKAWKDVEVL